MAIDLLIKNPGCTYCRFYIEPFVHKGEKTRGVCKKGARKVFEKSKVSIKNEDGYGLIAIRSKKKIVTGFVRISKSNLSLTEYLDKRC